MGILNVTPDSFSDGGRHLAVSSAVEAALRMVGDGADIIDVGGESTRPGAKPVPLDEEMSRVVPVVEALAQSDVRLSVDTMKAEVAGAALLAGAQVINDVTALRDPRMRRVCAEARCTVCLMHMQGDPATMQLSPRYVDVVAEVRQFLLDAALRAEADGIAKDRIWIDPGIGFGKTLEHNLALLKELPAIVELGYPVLVGVSRKGFLGNIGGGLPVEERLPGTLAAQVLAQSMGASVIRTHDVKEAKRAREVVDAVRSSGLAT